MRLILYSKPGCHLCEGLQEKLEQIQQSKNLCFDLEIRDIMTREAWFQAYQYEVPVLFVEEAEGRGQRAEGAGEAGEPGSRGVGEENSKFKIQNSKLLPIPRPSPRASVAQLEQMLQKYRVIYSQE